ncbi:MAG: prolyl oligopeptidase family serine peptidase, partial [Planctomycetota bacterium]
MRSRLVLIVTAVTLFACTPAPYRPMEETKSRASISYPEAQRGDVVDEYHGVKVADPYRWLEDSKTDETQAWIAAENELTDAYLAEIPEQERIRKRLESLWDYDKYGLPFYEGGRYFFAKKTGLQNQSVLHTQDELGGESRVLLDQNKLSEDGTASASGYSVSPNGKLLAYSVSEGGSDWRVIRVRDIETGKDLEDETRWVKFSSTAWAPKSDGYFYSRYAEPKEGESLDGVNRFQKLYFHKLGTDQSDDQLIYERPDQERWGFGADTTDDGEYLVVEVWDGTSPKNGLFVRKIDGETSFVELFSEFDAGYRFIHNVGSTFYIFTDLDAPRGRLVSVDVSASEPKLREIIPESEATLEIAQVCGGKLVARYLRDARSELVLFSLDGKREREIELPTVGSVSGVSGKPDQSDIFYAFSSFAYPTTIFRYNVETAKLEVFRKPDVDFDADAFEVKQVFVKSKDGTKVPMFLAHKKGVKPEGANPTYLYGYGGFNISIRPSFSIPNLVWMEMGGVYAVANLRGGGEYGESWHEAGTKTKKQNVFDDFIASAEWLVENRYTKPSRLSIGGRSNGGLLVGACMLQRPDLYGATLPGVGVLVLVPVRVCTYSFSVHCQHMIEHHNDCEECGVI